MSRAWKILIGVAVGLAVLLTLNAIAVSNDTKPAAVTAEGGRILQLSGGDVQVVDEGERSAPPIVLLHGWTASTRWYEALAARLARKYRVISIDFLGHGGSQKPSKGYSMPSQAQLVAEALHQLGVRAPVVVGHSTGGTVATALTERSPQLVAGLVILDQAPDNSYADVSLTQKMSRWPVLGQTLWRIVPDSQWRKGLGIAFADGYDVPDEFVEDLRGMTYAAYKESAASEDDFSGERPLDERLDPTGVPLLVVFGRDEQAYDIKAAEAYRDVAGAQIELIAGAGHSPHVEKPAQTAKLIEDFAAPIFAAQAAARKEAAQRKAELKRQAEKRKRELQKKRRAKKKAAQKRG